MKKMKIKKVEKLATNLHICMIKLNRNRNLQQTLNHRLVF